MSDDKSQPSPTPEAVNPKGPVVDPTATAASTTTGSTGSASNATTPTGSSATVESNGGASVATSSAGSDAQAKTINEVEGNAISEVDKLIEAEDPNFLNSMQDIQQLTPDKDTNIESLPVDGSTADLEQGDEPPVEGEDAGADGIRTKLQKVKLKFAAWVDHKKTWIKQKKSKISDWRKNFLSHAKKFALHDVPDFLRFCLKHLKVFFAFVKRISTEVITALRKLTLAQFISLGFALIAGVASLVVFSRVFLGGWLPDWNTPLISSLADHAAFVKKVNSKSDLQDFFNAFPEVEYHVLLKKVVVNLRPDENSTANPMGLYEVYLGLDSQDTAIEVKDREKEILDVIQRALERFSYSEVSSEFGKSRMKSAMKEELNVILNQGQVYHIYFNNFVTKP